MPIQSTPTIIPLQPHLPSRLPTVLGNVDYHQFFQQLVRIDQILSDSGIEKNFLDRCVQQWETDHHQSIDTLSAKRHRKCQEHAIRAIRCNLIRSILPESFRDLSARMADSPLLQWFCRLDQLAVIRVPSKSTLERYADCLPADAMRELISVLVRTAAQPAAAQQPQPLRLETPLDLDAYFLDTTCLKANIHFPVDWVLLRDVTRTLVKAIALIRKHGLKHRMADPALFLSRVNGLCMQMTHTRRKPDSRKARKAVLRQMKRQVKVIGGHARRHRHLLDTHWEETDLSRKQAEQILGRIDSVLEQLPRAVRQAHERIIGGRPVANAEKILSLYDSDVHVVVRGKFSAEVEFGNTLLLAEQLEGVIVDWKLYEPSAPADSRLVDETLQRIEQVVGADRIAAVTTDRGFDSRDNAQRLERNKIYNAICPRDPKQMAARNRTVRFRKLQKRRAQTEGRIGILQNEFFGRPMRAKGFANRELRVAWAVLGHNLWVIARLPCAEEKVKRKAA